MGLRFLPGFSLSKGYGIQSSGKLEVDGTIKSVKDCRRLSMLPGRGACLWDHQIVVAVSKHQPSLWPEWRQLLTVRDESFTRDSENAFSLNPSPGPSPWRSIRMRFGPNPPSCSWTEPDEEWGLGYLCSAGLANGVLPITVQGGQHSEKSKGD